MRPAFCLAAIVAIHAVRAQDQYTDGYYIGYRVDGPVLVDTHGASIASLSRYLYEGLEKANPTEEEIESGEEYLLDTDELVYSDGVELSVALESAMADGDTLMWYSCVPETYDYACDMVSYTADPAVTAGYTFTRYQFSLDLATFEDEDAEVDVFSLKDSVAGAVTTETTITNVDGDSSEQTNIILKSVWVDTTELTSDNTLTYRTVYALYDPNGTITTWTLPVLDWAPISPCYELEDTDETDFHQVWGASYTVSGGTAVSVWEAMDDEIFDALHEVCSGATTLVASAAVAALATLAF